jgi:hypothetical protein
VMFCCPNSDEVVVAGALFPNKEPGAAVAVGCPKSEVADVVAGVGCPNNELDVAGVDEGCPNRDVAEVVVAGCPKSDVAEVFGAARCVAVEGACIPRIDVGVDDAAEDVFGSAI